MKTALLKLEQRALGVAPAAVTAQRASRCDHPVAGDEDSDRIPVVGHAYGAVGLRMANRLGDVAVAAGFAIWNFEQCTPASEVESGPARMKGEGELASLTREVVVEFANVGRERRFGLTQLSRSGISFRHTGLECEPHQTFCGSGEKERADGRRRSEVEQSFHLAKEDSTMSCGDGAVPRPLPQIKNPPVFTGGLPREGTSTSAAVLPESTSVCCSSKQAAPVCSSGGSFRRVHRWCASASARSQSPRPFLPGPVHYPSP